MSSRLVSFGARGLPATALLATTAGRWAACARALTNGPQQQMGSNVQGQIVDGRREYFYYIDHTGALFLEDVKIKNFTSCFKDKEFLRFFFQRLKLNTTDRHQATFPYLSPCGREMNFVRAYDSPIVFQQLVSSTGSSNPQAAQAHVYAAGQVEGVRDDGQEQRHALTYVEGVFQVPFDPSQLMVCADGHFYHPAPAPFSRGLLSTKLAIDLSAHVDADHRCFVWGGQRYTIAHV